MTTTAIEVLPKSNVPAKGDWKRAKEKFDNAILFEKCKLLCQIECGFELMALKKDHGISQGKRTDLGTSANVAEVESWPELVKKHLGASETTARRMIVMAEVAAPRLKRFPELRQINLLATPLNQLTDKQVEAFNVGLKKITDGKTQADFGIEVGTAKIPQGGNSKGGGKGGSDKQNLSAEEQLKVARKMANEDFAAALKLVDSSTSSFILLEDIDIQAQIGALEKAIEARRKWVDTPKAKRDSKAASFLKNFLKD